MNLNLMGQEWLKTLETEPKEISIDVSKPHIYGAESCVPDVTPRKNASLSFAKGRRSRKTVLTTGQLQVLRQGHTALRTP